MSFKKGDVRILSIRVEGEYVPVGCLTSNNLEESVETLPTSTRASGGWRTSVPTTQEYSIPFEGVQEHDDITILNYTDLKQLKRNRTRIEWQIDGGGLNIDTGYGYITNINESNQTGEFLLFSGTIQGYGEPTLVLLNGDLWQDGNIMLFQDGTEMIFQ
jgi:hypothetical protein